MLSCFFSNCIPNKLSGQKQSLPALKWSNLCWQHHLSGQGKNVQITCRRKFPHKTIWRVVDRYQMNGEKCWMPRVEQQRGWIVFSSTDFKWKMNFLSDWVQSAFHPHLPLNSLGLESAECRVWWEVIQKRRDIARCIPWSPSSTRSRGVTVAFPTLTHCVYLSIIVIICATQLGEEDNLRDLSISLRSQAAGLLLAKSSTSFSQH